jgi:hypothetical protein
MRLIESVKDDEDLVFESLTNLYENEEILFNNFTLLTAAMDILFMLLKQDPTCTSKINCFIKEKVLKTWRLKQKTLATSLSSSLKKLSTSSSTSQLNQNRWPISAFKPPGYYRNRESPLNISRNEEPTENERNKEAVR